LYAKTRRRALAFRLAGPFEAEHHQGSLQTLGQHLSGLETFRLTADRFFFC